MPRPTPTPRQQPGRVVMQVARGGGPTGAEATDAVPSRGRHRTPDTGEVPASGSAEGSGSPRAAAGPTTPARHDLSARQAQIAARRTAPGSLERVEAAQAAAAHPASTPRTTTGPAPATPERTPSPRPATTPAAASRSAVMPAPARDETTAAAPTRTAPPAAASSAAPTDAPARPAGTSRPATELPADDDAVTDLVAGPTRRGRAGVPDGPGTGRVPGLVGLALGVLALVVAVIAAAAPDVVVPVIGRLGASPVALAGLVALGLLATACAGLGTGRQRRGRGAAVTGMVVGLAAVAAAVVPLVALASL